MSVFCWLASYPKSGNTWLRLALGSLLAGGTAPDFEKVERLAPIASDRDVFEAVLGVDSSDLTPAEILDLRPRQFIEEAAATGERQLRKVHEAWIRVPDGSPLFPPAVTRAAVYLLRDPRDVAVSLAHHNGVNVAKAVAQLNTEASVLAPGGSEGRAQFEQPLLSWSGHVASWVDAAEPKPLVLRYEDMLADMDDALARVARHLGIAADPEIVARAVAATRFDALQAEEERAGFREKSLPATRFFRRGVAGGWRDILTAEQADAIEQAHGAMMRRFGYL